MCIRDRINALVRGVSKINIDSFESVEPYFIAKVSELSDNCLLYTSDAADERSSVDLGGRRIIKKKKNYR